MATIPDNSTTLVTEISVTNSQATISQSVVSQSERTQFFLAQASACLDKTFDTSFAIWTFKNGWSQTSDSESCECPARIQWEVFDALVDLQEPVTIELTNKYYLLIIPFEIDYEPIMATAVIESSDPNLLERFATTWLQKVELQTQNRELAYENDGFVRQVTEDLEELTFLRQISEHLEVADANDQVASLASSLLKLVNCSLKAEQVLLVVNANDDQDFDPELECEFTSVGQPILDEKCCLQLLNQHCSMVSTHPLVINRIDPDIVESYLKNVSGFILAPVVKSGNRLGWLLAINRTQVKSLDQQQATWEQINCEFGSSEASLLSSTAAMLASHITNKRLFVEKEKLLTSVVRSLVSAIEAKDQYTRGHSERVALYARCLANEYGIGQIGKERIYLSGLLHDVGKIGIADGTLGKTSQLSDQEFAEIKRHPHEGWAILHEVEQLNDIIPGVLHHHERIDGKGYPDGLAGNAIPIDGRILAVADAFDAMTSDRPYRQGMPVEKALQIIKSGAGTQWDAELVDAFIHSIDHIVFIKENYRSREQPFREPAQSQIGD